MVVVDIVVAASAALVFGVVVLTAKFSREMPINKNFDELWFENVIKTQQEPQLAAEDMNINLEEKTHHSFLAKTV